MKIDVQIRQRLLVLAHQVNSTAYDTQDHEDAVNEFCKLAEPFIDPEKMTEAWDKATTLEGIHNMLVLLNLPPVD